MDVCERQKKLQAGREKFAEFLRKKNNPEKSKKRLLDGSGDKNHDGIQSINDDNSTSKNFISENDTTSDTLSSISSYDSKEADYKIMLEEYRRRIQEFQSALSQRDDIISQLSDRLMATLQNRDDIQTEAAIQAENLAQEISMLKLQLQQAREILERQKSKDGISAEEILELQKQIIYLQQELNCVKEELNKNIVENKLQSDQIEHLKVVNLSMDELKGKLDALQNEKYLLIEEINQLKLEKDNYCLLYEKSQASEILNEQLQKEYNILQENNLKLKDELDISLKHCEELTIAVDSSNEKIKEFIEKHKQYEEVLSQIKDLNQEVERLNCELHKSNTEKINTQQQLDASQFQLDNLNHQCIVLKEEIENLHKNYKIILEDTKRELTEKHEFELQEKEMTLKKEFTYFQEKLLKEEEEKYLKCKELLICQHDNELEKYKKENRALLEHNAELENRLKDLEIQMKTTEFHKVQLETDLKNNLVHLNHENIVTNLEYDKDSMSSLEISTMDNNSEKYKMNVEKYKMNVGDSEFYIQNNFIENNDSNSTIEESSFVQNIPNLTLEQFRKITKDDELQKYIDDAILKLKIDKGETESKLLDKINSLEIANQDLELKLEELKMQYDHLQSCKVKGESDKNNEHGTNSVCRDDEFFNQTTYISEIGVLKNKLHLESKIKESLYVQIINLKRKCELYENYQNEMRSQMEGLRQQLKYAWNQYDKVVKNIFDESFSNRVQNLTNNNSEEKFESKLEIGDSDTSLSFNKSDNLEMEISALRIEMKEMQEIFTKENTLLRSALHQQNTSEIVNTQNQCNWESDEVLNIHQKFLILMDSNHELLEEKQSLQIQLLKQEELFKKLLNLFDNENNDQQEILQQHLDELQQQNKNLIFELKQHTTIHGNISKLLSNDIFQEYLQIQKKLLLKKIEDKELLETEIARLKKELEHQTKEFHRLEEQLSQRHILEQALHKKKRILEEELSEIHHKLQEQEENLTAEKMKLKAELREKDLIIKQKELDVHQKQIELQGQAATLKADHEASVTNMHIRFSKEVYNYISKLCNDLETIHKQDMELLKNNMVKEFAAKEIKISENHRSELAELKKFYEEQITTLHSKKEHKPEELEKNYIENLGREELVEGFIQKWNKYYTEVSQFRIQLDLVHQNILDNIIIHCKKLKEEEMEQVEQIYKKKIIELNSQKEKLLKEEHVRLKNLEAKMNQEKIAALSEQHKILTEQSNKEVLTLIEKHKKEINLIKDQHKMAIEKVTVTGDKSAVNQIEIIKHQLAEEHHRYIEYLTNIWTKENSERLNKLKIHMMNAMNKEYRSDECMDIGCKEFTMLEMKNSLLEKKKILKKVKVMKHYIEDHIYEVELLQKHIKENYDILFEVYHTILDEKGNNKENFETLKDEDSDSEEISNEETHSTAEEILKPTYFQNNNMKDIFRNVRQLRNTSFNQNEEAFKKFDEYFKVKIQQMKIELENIVKRLIYKYQEEERHLEGLYEVKITDNLKQFNLNIDDKYLDEINEIIKKFGKEKSENIAVCFENIARSLYKSFFESIENGIDKFEEKIYIDNAEKETKENNHTENEHIISLFIKNALSDDDDTCDEIQNKLKTELNMINEELNDLKQKKKYIEEKFNKEVAILIQSQQKELILIQKQISSDYFKDKKLQGNDILIQIENLRKNQEGINMLWKRFSDEKSSLRLEKEKIIKEIKMKYLQEIGYLKDKIKELIEEKYYLLSEHKSEIEKINDNHERELHSLSEKLKNKNTDNNKNIEENNMIEEETMLNTFESTTEENILNQNSDISLEELKCDLMTKSRELKELQMMYNKKFEELGKTEEIVNSEIPFELIQIRNKTNDKNTITDETCQDLTLKSELLEEMEQLQLQMEKDMAMYNQENSHLLEELLQLKSKFREMEKSKKVLENELEKMKLKEKQKTKRLQSKQNKDWSSNTELSTVDVQSWQVQAAQTNSRLLHVLSDLVKTFFDIEQDINNRLIQLGLDAIHPAENSLQQDEEGALIPMGSREDFTVFMGESTGISLELSEDGPDLTPRSWDLFTSSIAAHEVEMEGEDVVLGASKRLRAAVERVLRLLTHAVEAQQTQDLRVLLHRNENLTKELQDEIQQKDFLQMEFIRVEALLRNSEQERQKSDDIINALKESKESLNKELNLLRRQLQYLEETQETLTEEKRYVKEQCQMLANNMTQAEQDKQMSPSDQTVSSKQVLLKENNKLNNDKHKLQQNHEKERQQLLSRLHHLELVLEETISQKEDLLEEKSHEIQDLKSQMESLEKQLISYKRFIEEQAQEREQERDEYLREVKKLQEIIKEKERIQNNDERLSREVEMLEQQLKSKIDDQREILKKREQAEADLRQSVDKIHDLRDVIRELENQLDIKTNSEKELNQKITNLEETLSHHEKENAELNNEIERLQATCANNELRDHIRALQEQLESKGQQLEQMKNCQSLLQEFHSYIHSLGVKIDSAVSSMELHKLPYLSSSPVPSDTSLSEHDGELRPLSEASLRLVDDIRVYSPSTSNWDEMRRFEDKLDNLVKGEEELLKINKTVKTELKNFKQIHEEILHEKIALQEQVNNQLLQISALKAQIEEHRHNLNGQMTLSNHKKNEIFQLQEDLLKEQQQQEYLNDKIQDLLKEIDNLKQEIEEKDQLLKSETTFNRSENETLVQEISSLKDENIDLKQEVEKLRSSSENHVLPDYAKLLLDDKNEEIEFLNQQVHNLQGLLETYHESKKEKKNQEMHSEPNECQKCAELQLSLIEATSARNNQQQQINTLLKELESLNNHHTKLQEDFDIIQKIADQQEKELVQLQEETYNQRKEYQEEEINPDKLLEIEENGEILKINNCLECKELNEQLTTLKTNFNKENVHLIMTLEQLQNKLVEVEHKNKEEKEMMEKNYKMQIENINLEAKNVECMLKKTHEEEISHIKSHLEGIFQDEKEMLINLHKEKLNSLENNMKQSHENEKAELKNHFQEILQACKDELTKIHNSEKEKLENEHDENMNYVKSQYEKQICSERINSQEKHEELMKEFEMTLKRNWEEEKNRLISLHQNEIDRINTEMKGRISILQSNFEEAYQNKLAQVESNYKHEIKILKSLLNKTRSDSEKEITPSKSLCLREDASNSDIASVENTPEEEMQGLLPSSLEKLLKKVYKEGVQVLSLTERQLLKHHLTPSLESGKPCLTSEEWLQERQMLLNEIYSLKELIKEGVENKNWKDTADQIVLAFRKEQEKLINKLRNEVHGPDNAVNSDNKKLDERITDLEMQNEALNTHVTNKLVEEYKSATEALNSQQIHYVKMKEELEHKLNKAEEEKTELEEQLKTQRNVLEFRIKQEKVLSEDLQKSLDIERTQNVDLRSQLNRQQKAYMELESSYSTYKAEIVCLRKALEQLKQHLSNCLNALDMEKASNRSLLQALEREQTNFSSLQAEFDTEKKCGKIMQEYEQQIIKLHRLYWKYRRSESYRQALVFQKNYLLMLLEGFQSTEKQTLTTLKCMMIGGNMDENRSTSSSSRDIKYNLHGFHKFRSSAYVIIAIHRMKYLVHRWRKAAKILSSRAATQEINSEEQDAIKNDTVFNPNKLQSSSSPSSLHGHHHHHHHFFNSNSLPCRKQSIQSNPTVSENADSQKKLKMLPKPSSDVEIRQIEMERGRLGEYITRLEFLHQQLGLNTRDK